MWKAGPEGGKFNSRARPVIAHYNYALRFCSCGLCRELGQGISTPWIPRQGVTLSLHPPIRAPPRYPVQQINHKHVKNMSTSAKASIHIKPCNIAQSEAHNRRDKEYLKSLDPKKIYIRLDLTSKNETYISPRMGGKTLQEYLNMLRDMVKEKTGRAMQEKDVKYKDKNGKTHTRRGSSPLREGVVVIKETTTRRGGASTLSRYISTGTKDTLRTSTVAWDGNRIFTHTSSGTGWTTPPANHAN